MTALNDAELDRLATWAGSVDREPWRGSDDVIAAELIGRAVAELRQVRATLANQLQVTVTARQAVSDVVAQRNAVSDVVAQRNAARAELADLRESRDDWQRAAHSAGAALHEQHQALTNERDHLAAARAEVERLRMRDEHRAAAVARAALEVG